MWRWSKVFLSAGAVAAITGITAWCALALYLGPLRSTLSAIVLAVIGAFTASAVVIRRLRLVAMPVFGVALVCFGVVWSGVRASNERDWQPDVAVMPYATSDGDLVTIHNIRNFDYRTETDYVARYYDKTFDLREIDSADLVASYWMGDAIAHIMVSFGFGERDFVTVSIETRKTRGQSYSTLEGFFRNYGLIYIVGDERDLIRLRTNIRKDPPEDVYLFRSNAPPENIRRTFLDYVKKINLLAEKPEFYNTLTTNCTTDALTHTRVNPGAANFSWQMVLSGYLPQYAYEVGRLDGSMPFAELKRRSHINEAARAANAADDFSQRIRAGLPRPVRRRG